MRVARIVLAVLGTVFFAQGSVQLFQPELLTDLININAESITGRIELQVIYGGLHMAFGAMCLWGASNEKYTRTALIFMLFVSIGVAIPRVALGFIYWDFSLYSVVAMVLESVSLILIVGLLRFLPENES